jgi:serine/threonine-protein kinase
MSPPRSPPSEGSLPIELGEVLAGKYRVDQVLGQGGMAVVLAGTHVELDAPIAIKVLLPARAGNQDAVRRFLTEARAAAKLKSANVARIHDVGVLGRREGPALPFIVMERLDGVDLATLMGQHKKLPVEEAVDYIRQACVGLAEAHALSIIHRDIKPANLFLTRTREGAPLVKVLDFGISKTLAAAATHEKRAITSDQEVMGSPGYMSPEQVTNARDVDPRTDIWSLGIVLHELVSGKEAMSGDEIHEIFASILHGQPATLDDDVPDEVQTIIMRCLEKDRNRRYQTIEQLGEALAHALDRPQGVPQPRSLASRVPVLAGIGAAVALAAGILVVARGRPEPPPPDPGAAHAALSLESAPVTKDPPVAASTAPPPIEPPAPAVEVTPAASTAQVLRPATKATAPASAPGAPATGSQKLPAAPVKDAPWTNHKRTTW